jgi:Malic enzyme, NAD binding domain
VLATAFLPTASLDYLSAARLSKRSGSYDGTALGGLNVALAVHTPGPMAEGNWSVGVKTLANLVPKSDLERGSLYPALPRIREVFAHIAAAVAQNAYEHGLALGSAPNDLLVHVQSHMYDPGYCDYVWSVSSGVANHSQMRDSINIIAPQRVPESVRKG